MRAPSDITEADAAAISFLAQAAEDDADNPSEATARLVTAALAILKRNLPPKSAVDVLEAMIRGAQDGFRESIQ